MPLIPTRTRDYRRVIVERDAHAEFTVGPKGYRTRGGIDVPDVIARKGQTDRKNPRATFGTVRYVGQGVTEVRPGDRVCFWELAGTDIKHRGERLTVLPETELLAVLERSCVMCGGYGVHECTGGRIRHKDSDRWFYDTLLSVRRGLVDAACYSTDEWEKA